jgi:hypothetical protein
VIGSCDQTGSAEQEQDRFTPMRLIVSKNMHLFKVMLREATDGSSVSWMSPGSPQDLSS